MMERFSEVNENFFFECEACNECLATKRNLLIHQATCPSSISKTRSEEKSKLNKDSPTSTTIIKTSSNETSDEWHRNKEVEVKVSQTDNSNEIVFSFENVQDFAFSKKKMYSSKPSKEPTFTCWKCGKIFRNHENYQKHVNEEYCFTVDKPNATKDRKINEHQIQKPKENVNDIFSDFSRIFRQLSPSQSTSVLPQNDKTRLKNATAPNNQFKEKILERSECSICQKTFCAKGTLVRHLKNVHKCSLPSQPRISQKTLTTQKSIDSHIPDTDEKSSLFSCKICQKSLSTKSCLVRHMKEIHENPSLFPCTICQKKLSTKRYLVYHMKEMHENPLVFHCMICKKRLSSKGSLNLHIKEIHEKSAIFHCKICQKKLSSKRGLDRHIKSIHENPLIVYKSPNSLASKSNIDLHIKEIHEKSAIFHCKICQKILSSKRALDRHIKNIHGNPLMFHKSPNSLGSKNKIGLHIKEIHKEPRLFHCTICQKKYKLKRNLDSHFKKHKDSSISLVYENSISLKTDSSVSPTTESTDQNQKRLVNEDKVSSIFLKCNICGIMFLTTRNLQRHMKKTHKSPPSAKCHICQNKFINPWGLKRHINNVHEKIRPSKCNLCNKSFTRSYLLTHKKYVHSSIPRLQYRSKCQWCDKLYSNRSLKRHLKTCPIINNKIQKSIKIKSLSGKTGNKSTDTTTSAQEDRILDSEINYESENIATETQIVRNNDFHSKEDCRRLLGDKKFPVSAGKSINKFRLKLPRVQIEKKSASTLPQLQNSQVPSIASRGNKTIVILFTKNGQDYVKCDICPKVMVKHNLDTHKKFIHENPGSFKCSICKLKFNWKKNLNSHVKSIHNNRQSFKCNLCNRLFHLKAYLNFHIINVHTNVRRFHCKNCDFESNRKQVYIRHKKLCSDNNAKTKCQAVSCKSMNEKETISNLEIGKKENDVSNRLKCNICGIALFSIPGLTHHMNSHNQADLKRKFSDTRTEDCASRKLQKDDRAENISEIPAKHNLENNWMKSFQTSEKVADDNYFELESPPTKTAEGQLLKPDDQHAHERPSHSVKVSRENVTDSTKHLNERLALLRQKYSNEGLAKNQCGLCFVTCVDAAAIEAHLKRHE